MKKIHVVRNIANAISKNKFIRISEYYCKEILISKIEDYLNCKDVGVALLEHVLEILSEVETYQILYNLTDSRIKELKEYMLENTDVIGEILGSNYSSIQNLYEELIKEIDDVD